MAFPIFQQPRMTRIIWNPVSPALLQPSRGPAPRISCSRTTCNYYKPMIKLSRKCHNHPMIMPMISMNSSSEFSSIFNVPMFFKASAFSPVTSISTVKQRAYISRKTDTILNNGSLSTSTSIDDHNGEESKKATMKRGVDVKSLSWKIPETIKINVVAGGAGLARLLICCLLLQCLALSGGGGGGGFVKLHRALAYTGGVMGGGSFSSGSSYSSSSYDSDGSYSSGRTSSSSDDISKSDVIFCCYVALAFVVVILVIDKYSYETKRKTSILKLQVGLTGTARSLQRELNRIAVTADTSDEKGLNCMLTETIQALLQHPDFCTLGYSSVDVEPSICEGEHRFYQLSGAERKKFKKETLVNLNGIQKQSAPRQRADESMNEYIVITILVAVRGGYQLPTIRSSGDLKAALTKLSSIPSNKTRAVQVLWAPQDENDSLSLEELRKDYSELQPLFTEYSPIRGEDTTPTRIICT